MASKIKDFLQANIFTPSFNKRIDDGATMFGELLLIVFGSIVIFFGLFVFFIILCVVIAPDDYVFRSVPELQISRTQENTYLAFYENGDKKPKFCQGIYDSSITFTTEMTAQSFCHFTYQPLPKLRGNVDISITEI